uniref:Uncharacterized protein n=1 Tax=Ascaris lumbricoides TaxID=6252 RepID=A0A0M3HTW1_ASCLU
MHKLSIIFYFRLWILAELIFVRIVVFKTVLPRESFFGSTLTAFLFFDVI